MKKIVILSAAALLTVGMAANADTHTGAYVFGGANYSTGEIKLANSDKADRSAAGLSLGGGYNFTKNISVQAQYNTAPEVKDDTTKQKLMENGYNISVAAKYSMPVAKKFDVYVLGGLDYVSYKAANDITIGKEVVAAGDHAGITGIFGAGAGYKLNDKMSIDFTSQLSLKRESKDFSTPANLINTVSVSYSF